ncbi:MAG: hypothetical protein R8K48_00295 [Gallionella sp.]
MTAIRFCMRVIGKSMQQTNGISERQNQLIANATALDYATRLGSVFHAVITGALDEVKPQLGDRLSQVRDRIEQHVENVFVHPLQVDVRTMRLETK